MLKLRKVAVTGSLAAGKSTLCSLFQELGAYVISADQIVHQLLSQDIQAEDIQVEDIQTESKKIETKAIRERVVLLLGNQIIVDGNIDRKKVAEIVFQSPALLKELEQIIHPYVKEEIKRMYEHVLKENRYSLFVVEIPLFFEALAHLWKDFTDWFDYTVSICAEDETRQTRFIKKTHLTSADFTNRASLQMSQEEKRKRADFVITNDGTIEDLKESAKKLYQTLIS